MAAAASVSAATTRVVDNPTDTAVAGQTSLRQAVAASADGDAIEFSPALFNGSTPVVIKLGTALQVTRSISIIGPDDLPANGGASVVLQSLGTDRLLQVKSPASAVFAGLAFKGGVAAGGGAVLIDAGAAAVFTGCDFVGNTATGATQGGAILNRGLLTLDQCLVTGNTAGGDGGGIAGLGRTQVARSLIDSNTAKGYGGGFFLGSADGSIESSTVSNNRGGTGAISLVLACKAGNLLTVLGSTITGNSSSAQTGGLYVEGSGALAKPGGSIFARNVIVNSAGAQTPHDLGNTKSGQITSLDYNLVLKPGTTCSPWAAHDLVGVDPQLGALAYNGGRTRTFALGAGSPARDKGNPTFTGVLVNTDQRGQPRAWPVPGGRADVGAFEFNAALTLDAPVTLEATGPTTPRTVGGQLLLPRGGSVTVKWTIGGVTGPASTLTIPDNCLATPLSYSGSFAVGTTSVGVTVQAGTLTLTAATSVKVVDTTPPTLNLPADQILEATGPAGAVATYSATASDLVSGNVPVVFDPPSGSTFALGSTVVRATATDAAGNVAAGVFTITVRDTTRPVLNAPGDIVAEATGPAGAVVTFSGSASDTVSGSLPVKFTPASGSVFPLGTTVVSASATDGSGNTTTKTFQVTVRDTTPPVLTAPGNLVVEATGPTGAVVGFGGSASDLVSGSVPVLFSIAPGSVFPLGTTSVIASATDGAGNTSSATFTVTVQDTTPPAITTPADLVAEATGPAGAVVNFAPTASDLVDGAVTVVAVPASGSTFPLGTTTVQLTATDAAHNVSTSSFKVTVQDTTPPALTLPANIAAIAKNAGGAVVTFAPTATDAVSTPVIVTSVPSGSVFAPGTTTVNVTATDAAGNVASGSFTVTVTDPFNVTLNNVAWPLAVDFDGQFTPSGGKLVKVMKQMLTRPGESRWYKFKGLPGSKIDISLTNLPANFDIVVYGDIQKQYNNLLALTGAGSTAADNKAALLGADFAPEAYSPEAYSPEAYSPEAYSPEAYSPEAYSPEAYSPEAYSPEAYSPEAYSPEAYSPEAYSPEAYAAAQQRSLIAFSARPGTLGEGIRLTTYSRTGEFYIRVRGQNGVFSTDAPFSVTVAVELNLAGLVTNLDTTPASVPPAIAGAPTSLLVWDSGRMPGTPAEKAALATTLANFAAAAHGVVLDVAGDAQIVTLNAQADANPDVPLAKNLVAETIRNLILRYRQAAPTLADLTLVGDDAVIPFFRSDDHALLASEANYFPPVKDGTQSQSSLRYAQVLSQDRYGSTTQITLGTGPYDLPELPVGRVVETAAEVTAYLNRYLPLFNGGATAGTLPTPHSEFVAGYDFLADSAAAVRDDFAAGLGSGATIDTLIAPEGQAPALGWTADQFRASFLGSRHDLAYLAGHFSTARALAADFTTRVRAQDVLDSSVDLGFSLIMSAGCHSGYNTVDQDAVPLVTDQPDWAQAFSRKGAMWIAGTGYQYGDTDFIEYTERLLLDVTQALRTGSGPVSVGQAIVAAKRRYLADTPIMRGIHEKTLLELAYYGLPMVKLNLPGARLASTGPAPAIAGVTPVPTGPGTDFHLATADLDVHPTLTRVDQSLTVVGATGSVTASYFTGPDGFVTVPGEPVRPKQTFNVSRPSDGFVRGVGFRAAQYHDLGGFTPFTGAPATEIRGVHGSFSTEVFFPVRPWSLNQSGELNPTGGSSLLNLFATQFVSDSPIATTGTERAFDEMRFTLYYSPDTSPAALANPPAVNSVTSTVDPAGIHFNVEVAAAIGAGVQEVWVTYTGLPGSPFYGAWQSLTLTGPGTDRGIGFWTGTLPLGAGVDPSQMRFMVQAVNGVGGVTQVTNFGRFFIPNGSTLAGAGTTAFAHVAFVGTVPTSGPYRSTIPVQAQLTDDGGQPIAGRVIQFQVGPATVSAITDTNGLATSTLLLSADPDDYPLEASFAGDAAYQPAADVRPFTVTKMGTTLAFGATGYVADASQVVVTLRANDGTPLTDRTVVFLLDNGTVKTASAETTDGAGQAHLSVPVAPGSYTIAAVFGQPVTLPDGSVAALNDNLYYGSTASAAYTIGRTFKFSKDRATVLYSDLKAPGATKTNPGVTSVEFLATITSDNPAFRPNQVPVTTKSLTVGARLTLSLSGRTLANGVLTLQIRPDCDDTHWYGTATINGAKVIVYIDWDDARLPAVAHVWVYPPAGSGPLYNATPALLDVGLTLGTGTGEHPIAGSTEVGGADFPWVKQTGTARSR